MSTKDLFYNTIITDNIIVGNVREFDKGVIVGARLVETLNINYGVKIVLISSEGFDALFGVMRK